MAEMNMINWRNSVLESKKRKAIPIMSNPGIDIIGKRVIDAVTDGETHCRAIRALDSVFPSDAATIIMDLTVEAEAFGATVDFPENEVPHVIGRLLRDENSITGLAIPDLGKGRIKEFLCATKTAASLISKKPVLGGCIGPFSLAGRLYGMTEIMTGLLIEHQKITLLVEKCSRFILSYAKAMKETGANGIIMAEPAAGLLDAVSCELFSSSFIRMIVSEIQDENFLFVLHNCGNTGHLTRSMISTGAYGLHFGNVLNMAEALKTVPEDILVLGNLDPVGVFMSMSPERLQETTLHLLESTRKHSNFILSSGCDTPPHVPPGNIAAFYEALKRFNEN